jgi:acyl dehydratase
MLKWKTNVFHTEGELLTMQQGMYFEDFEPGMELVTQSRMITESDIMSFAGLSGDYNPMHTDAEYAKETMFGERIAHGMLVLSIATGLGYRLGFLEGTVLAFRALEWKFSKPVFIGDTLQVHIEVKECREMKRIGGGQVTLDARVLNQDDEITQRGQWVMLMKSRESDE